MDIKEIIRLQKEFDNDHGWGVSGNDFFELINMLKEDLVGLFGEIGELANIIKKINLDIKANTSGIEDRFETDIKPQIAEELIDSLIYLLRLTTHLDINIEEIYRNKLELNRKRFEKYRK